MVLMFAGALFPGFKVLQTGHFRVIRDSEMEIDEEAQESLLKMETVKQKGSDNQTIEFDKIKLEDLGVKD